ncbi:MAG: hypothetical protein F9K13_02625 [Candidatus Methylomirabilis oxygeniifera]|uniref:Uncharacterized protein n=1 Tax=Methylomirabilis oxygeniifera TaxID=671143 RepID=D5MF52_METO1|nr:MAG: hypothetical protein F9K13_02625 [Candidatus Methylomirabilis oxyfera]CBE68381.1 protein of unknown function [Candidatus Methylomirabilis oxyfera]
MENIYTGNFNETTTAPQLAPPFASTRDSRDDFAGGNILTRWRRRLIDGSEFRVQFYYDRTDRRQIIREARDTVDLNVQPRFGLGAAHDIIWGFDTRGTIDAMDNTSTVVPRAHWIWA